VPNNLGGQVRDNLRNIHQNWLQSGRPANDLTVAGGDLLLALTDVFSPNANLDQFAPVLQPSLDFMGTAIQNVAQRYAQCQGAAPNDCPAGAAPVVFLDYVGVVINGGASPDAFRSGLNQAVAILTQQGMIPVLVTLPGRPDDQNLAVYNTIVFRVAEENNLPLLNLYAIGANNPALLGGDGRLSDPGAGFRAEFTLGALQSFGLNNAVLGALQMIELLRGAVLQP
jgi:hypothetical protein